MVKWLKTQMTEPQNTPPINTESYYPDVIKFDERRSFAVNFNEVYKAYKIGSPFTIEDPYHPQFTITGDFAEKSVYKEKLEKLHDLVKADIEKDPYLKQILLENQWDEKTLTFWQYRVTKIIESHERECGIKYKTKTWGVRSRDIDDISDKPKEFDCEHYAITYGLIFSILEDEYKFAPPATEKLPKNFKTTGNLYYTTSVTDGGGHAFIYSPYNSSIIDMGDYHTTLASKKKYEFENFKNGEGFLVNNYNNHSNTYLNSKKLPKDFYEFDTLYFFSESMTGVIKPKYRIEGGFSDNGFAALTEADLINHNSLLAARIEAANNAILDKISDLSSDDKIIDPKEFKKISKKLEDIKEEFFYDTGKSEENFEIGFSQIKFINELTNGGTININGQDITIRPAEAPKKDNNSHLPKKTPDTQEKQKQ